MLFFGSEIPPPNPCTKGLVPSAAVFKGGALGGDHESPNIIDELIIDVFIDKKGYWEVIKNFRRCSLNFHPP